MLTQNLLGKVHKCWKKTIATVILLQTYHSISMQIHFRYFRDLLKAYALGANCYCFM